MIGPHHRRTVTDSAGQGHFVRRAYRAHIQYYGERSPPPHITGGALTSKEAVLVLPIHKDVAEYWREHYDLRYLLQRDWFKLGPKLEGKIHVYVGTGDNYFLDGAVHYLEDFLKTVPYGGEVKYGDRAEHCWNGDPNLPNHLSRMRYNTLYLPKMLQRMESTAPPGADLKSWRY